MARSDAAGPEARLVLLGAELRQAVEVAGAEGGPAGDHAGTTATVAVVSNRNAGDTVLTRGLESGERGPQAGCGHPLRSTGLILETGVHADVGPMSPRPGAAEPLARRLEGLNLYLVGMMGAGKSAVGRPLAEALGYRFIDADLVLQEAAGRPIATIFAEEGEQAFRDLETAVLDRIAGWHSLVVATGGGVVGRPTNWGHLHQGVVIWLDAPADLLLQRLSADPTPRPLLATHDPAARLRQLLDERRPLYAQADLTVTQGWAEDPVAVTGRVLEALPMILRERTEAPEQPITLQDAEGQPRRSFN